MPESERTRQGTKTEPAGPSTNDVIDALVDDALERGVHPDRARVLQAHADKRKESDGA